MANPNNGIVMCQMLSLWDLLLAGMGLELSQMAYQWSSTDKPKKYLKTCRFVKDSSTSSAGYGEIYKCYDRDTKSTEESTKLQNI